MVQVTIGWGGEFEGTKIIIIFIVWNIDLPEADVVEGFVINAVGLISVFNKLMN